ncbi:MAG: hypothetical protein ACLPYS_19055 [Vulcanimicrobiaceae bacterium]
MASRFLQAVSSRDRSRYVAEAVAARLDEREQRLIRACEIANEDPHVLAVERDFDAIHDGMIEP